MDERSRLGPAVLLFGSAANGTKFGKSTLARLGNVPRGFIYCKTIVYKFVLWKSS